MSKTFLRVHMVLQQDAKLAEKYKGPCCGSQGGAGLDLFRKNMLFSCKEVSLWAFRLRPSSSWAATAKDCAWLGLLHLIISGQRWTPLTSKHSGWVGWDLIRSSVAEAFSAPSCFLPLFLFHVSDSHHSLMVMSVQSSDSYVCLTLSFIFQRLSSPISLLTLSHCLPFSGPYRHTCEIMRLGSPLQFLCYVAALLGQGWWVQALLVSFSCRNAFGQG